MGTMVAAPNAEIALGQAGWALTVLFAPPGLAVDYHNERLYWADAKLSVIGSIRLNGTDPIVAADSKRGQHPPAASASPDLTPVSVFPSEPQASLSTCQPPQPGPQQSFLFCFLFFRPFRAAPAACGGSQARSRIRAVAAGLHHSHSNARSEPGLQPAPQLTATLDP